MHLYAITNLLTSLSSLLLGAFVFFKGRDKVINKTFSLWAVSVGMWSFGIYGHALTTNDFTAMLWTKFLHGPAIFIPTLFLQFTLSLVNASKAQKKILPFMYVFSLIFFVINFGNFNNLFFADIKPTLAFQYFPRAGIIYPLYVIMFFFCVTFSLRLMLRAYHKYVGIKRNQIKYIFWGALLGYIGGSTTFLPMFGIKLFPYGNYFVSVYVLAVCYAIVKHQLMDINIVLRKGAVYAYLVFFILIPCAIIIFFGQKYFFDQTNIFFSLLTFCTLLLSSVAILRLKPDIEEYIERSFFKTKFQYKRTLRELSEIIISFLDEKELFKKAANILIKDLGAKKISFFLLDREKRAYTLRASQNLEKSKVVRELSHHDPLFKWLRENGHPVVKEVLEQSEIGPCIKPIVERLASMESEVCIPLMTRDHLIGIINLGQKRKGEMYSHEDLDLLIHFATQASIALENARLYQEMQRTQTLMRRTDRMASLGSLTAGLAHEIRNPLVAIKTFLDLLPERYMDKEFRGDFLKLTASEVDRINTLVTELLNFARPTKPKFKKGDVNQVIKEVISLVLVKASKSDIIIDTNLLETPRATFDAEQMKQVFLNIFLNAIDAISTHGKISVKSRRIRKNGVEYVEVEIADTGKGISKKIVEQIFDPFFTTKEKGIGLGLSISHQIVQEHNGTIEVESQPKKGTTFFINIPCES